MRQFLVISPEYGEVIPILDFGQGPIEYGRDVLEITAKNRGDARKKAWDQWRANGMPRWMCDNISDGSHPLAGVTIEEVYEDVLEEK